jgi:glycosyltransferase involved in cell wall biosynthesis
MSAPAIPGLISVVLPTRNRLALLQRAVDSVLAQTYRELELIVVDDGSTDGTREWLAAHPEPRLRRLHRAGGQGAAAARNAGLAEARGEYVAFQDDDDIWLVQKLEKQLAALRAAGPDCGWCLSGYLRMEPGRTRFMGGAYYVGELDWRRGIGEGGPDWYLISTPGWLVRRELLVRVGGFDEGIRSWDDWELGLRLWQVTRLTVADEPLWVQDRLAGGGLTRAEHARAYDLRIIMQKHAALWHGRSDVLARHHYTIGRTLSLYEARPSGRAELRQALRIRPLAPRTWLALAASYFDRERMDRLTRRIRRLKGALA